MAKKVLIVDDSRAIRREVSALLVAGGYEVIEAVDGLDGAEKIEQLEGLSGVICDLNMPRMNGIQMLRRIKEGGRQGTTPIVMLTTEGSETLAAEAKSLGAKGWIIKPFKPSLLLEAIRKMVGD